MSWRTFIWKILTPKLPIWSNGVECEVCQSSFVSAEQHYHFAKQQKLVSQHEGLVPRIVRKR